MIAQLIDKDGNSVRAFNTYGYKMGPVWYEPHKLEFNIKSSNYTVLPDVSTIKEFRYRATTNGGIMIYKEIE
jgi:hypothetical protein